MNCCQCEGIEQVFDHKLVSKEVRVYHEKGLNKESRILVEALVEQGIEGCSLMDIGGGMGGLSLELLKKGISGATNVEASSASIAAANNEASNQDLAGRLTNISGNFLEIEADIPAADVVTLNKVICCYDDMPGLVSTSVEKARKFYAVVYPRDKWWVKTVIGLINLYARIKKSGFRSYVYPTKEVDGIIRENGMRQLFHKEQIEWQIVVYGR